MQSIFSALLIVGLASSQIVYESQYLGRYYRPYLAPGVVEQLAYPSYAAAPAYAPIAAPTPVLTSGALPAFAPAPTQVLAAPALPAYAPAPTQVLAAPALPSYAPAPAYAPSPVLAAPAVPASTPVIAAPAYAPTPIVAAATPELVPAYSPFVRSAYFIGSNKAKKTSN
ncbi:unnamed protein product [Caenorhabditis angaria]|uniref:Uncharacterized protein n=1 Tax=Caenorhabditis angaria TaxID=860376 RepID=A0A9P1IVC4_9PELO|nr:unnamed protein product [Caenorhabditis angaria]